MRKIKKIRRYN